MLVGGGMYQLLNWVATIATIGEPQRADVWPAAVEEGGKAAAEASAATPGEALFPVTLLARAKVFAGRTEVGTCVDAMAGERSGGLAYVVVSEGGVAGVGERLRRLDWGEAHIDRDRLVTLLDADRFRALPELDKDQWPGR